MWGSDNRKMGLHVSDQKQDPVPCLAPPVPQEHLPQHMELLVRLHFLLPLALVDNAGICSQPLIQNVFNGRVWLDDCLTFVYLVSFDF